MGEPPPAKKAEKKALIRIPYDHYTILLTRSFDRGYWSLLLRKDAPVGFADSPALRAISNCWGLALHRKRTMMAPHLLGLKPSRRVLPKSFYLEVQD